MISTASKAMLEFQIERQIFILFIRVQCIRYHLNQSKKKPAPDTQSRLLYYC